MVNLLAELRCQLRGSPCRPFTGDGSVETFPGQIRRPDAGVDCGRRDPDGVRAASPRLVAEVLSPTIRDFDAFEKLAEYKQLDSLGYILMVEPNAPEACGFGIRAAFGSGTSPTVSDKKSRCELGVTLPLAESMTA